MTRRGLFKFLGGMTATPAVAEAIRQIDDAKILKLEPGDTLVLTSKDRLTPRAIDHLIENVRRHFPNNKAILLDGGLDLKIIKS